MIRIIKIKSMNLINLHFWMALFSFFVLLECEEEKGLRLKGLNRNLRLFSTNE